MAIKIMHMLFGGRQGCRLQTVLFILYKIRAKLINLGLILHVVGNDVLGFTWRGPCAVSMLGPIAQGATAVAEALHMQTTMLQCWQPIERTLLTLAPLALQVIRKKLGKLGFSVNWAPGKTEAFEALRGRNPLEAQSRSLIIW